MRGWRRVTRGWPALAAIALLAAWFLVAPTGKGGEASLYTADDSWEGAPRPTAAQLAGRLQRAGAVRSSLALRLVWKVAGGDRNIRLGPLSWDGGEWPWEIAAELTRERQDPVRVTLTEGMSTVAAARELCAAFLRVEANAAACAQSILETSTYWAFPDTYRFDRTSWVPPCSAGNPGCLSPADMELYRLGLQATLTAPLEGRLAQIWGRLDPSPEGSPGGGPGSRLMALAGLVAAEAALASERPRVAGVIANRLDLDMALQIDASALYCLALTGQPRPTRVLYRHLRTDCPFNTYMHKGLPPGPVALPGRPSLAAALAPEEHEFLFYVLAGDGPGHIFAADLQTHNQNIRTAKYGRSP